MKYVVTESESPPYIEDMEEFYDFAMGGNQEVSLDGVLAGLFYCDPMVKHEFAVRHGASNYYDPITLFDGTVVHYNEVEGTITVKEA